ncbi:MAG: dTDP-4-dehydrorhamnose 3,5-epimerase [Chloroflexota bacterium]
MSTIIDSEKIQGVQFAPLRKFEDERGFFSETFRKEWFPQRSWEIVQTNRSSSGAGVLRGLHYHFHQVDYWYVTQGTLRVGLADIRPASPTYMASEVIEIGDTNSMGVFIPVGVAHGFVAVTDATLFYIVDNYYDGGDEHGVAWNDPQLNVAWGLSDLGITAPDMSGRDRQNPLLRDIATEKMPQ